MKIIKTIAINLISIVVFVAIACAVMYYVSVSGIYPQGYDTMYHIYRGDQLYNSILNGDYYPLINFGWYNGVELMRYWAPLCAYTMAGTQAVCGGDMMNGYILYVGVVFMLGALTWIYIGDSKGRPVLGGILGIIWFFMPNNLYALFGEGNLPRALSMVFLPVLVYAIKQYLDTYSISSLVIVTISFVLIVLCHLGYAGMVALAVLLFLLIDKIITRRKAGALRIIEAILIGFALTGIWIIPSLHGGISGVDSSETMAGFFQSILISLNPFYRYRVGNTTFYFGLAAFILAIFGIIAAKKSERAGFTAAIIILFMTTNTMFYFIKLLPGSQYLWMLRFISIALCFILIEFMYWKSLKWQFILLVVVALALDIVPSCSLITGNMNGADVDERLNEISHEYMIDQAQDVTSQRLALIDESALGSMGAFLPADWGKPIDMTFGAGWEAANTSSNISQINRAMHEGNYVYLFDRAIELGNDTVLVRLANMYPGTSVDDLDNAAAISGYTQVAGNTYFRMYHLNSVNGNFGVKSNYKAIAIGDSTSNIVRMFPAIRETSEKRLDQYSYEELSKYSLIYLSGFAYDNRDKAEELVVKLSSAGTRIIIIADGIPENRETHDKSFLGAVCQPIAFSQGYPLFDTIIGELDTDFFPAGNLEWNTFYVNGLDNVWGKVKDNKYDIPFIGTVCNDNIIIIGLNLVSYNYDTGDEATGKLISKAFDMDYGELPEREIVPIQISRGYHSIIIDSEEDNVNTTLAYHDIFVSDNPIRNDNNLLVVDSGRTVVTYSYPYFKEGLIVSLVSVMVFILFLIFEKRTSEKQKLKRISN